MATQKKKILVTTTLFIPLIALIALVTLLFFQPRQLTDLEQISFEEKTHDVANFLELFDPTMQSTEENPDDEEEPKNEDLLKCEENAKKISFALQLNYAETKNDELGVNEAIQIVNDHFATQLTGDILQYEGLDFCLNKHQVNFHENDKTFVFHNPYSTKKSVINTPITKYLLKSVQRKNNTYFATYSRYVINNPYAALNRTSQDNTQSKYSVNEYLDGHGTQLSIKELITAENVTDIAESNGEIEVSYVVSEDKVLLEDIKSNTKP